MAITAALVKELRERSGAAMMDCKRALQATDGDIEAALEKMRKDGQAKADKKAGRVAAEGVVAIAIADDAKTAAMVEYNCETDFVSKGDEFLALANEAADVVLSSGNADIDAVLAAEVNGRTLDQARRDAIAKLGENMGPRRAVVVAAGEGVVTSYSHGGRIGVLVALEGGDEALGRDIAMHVAASNPQFIDAGSVPADVQAKERDILIAQSESSGKPREIIEKMVDGRMRKFLAEITLVGQPFVKDPDMTVEQLLKKHGAKVTEMVRLEVGEGVEKDETNFADEVAAQAKEAMGA